jgi:hypothetical protein
MLSERLRRPLTLGHALVVLVVAAVIGGGAFAVAAIPGPDGKIKGCVKKSGRSKGALRAVDHNRSCSRSEKTLRWNQTGPRGFQGLTGATGHTGPTGPQGPDVILGTMGNVTDSTLFASPIGSSPAGNTPASVSVLVPPNGGFTATDFSANATGGSLGTGTSYTFTFNKNNVDTGLSCTITDPAMTCTSAPGATATFAPGDVIRLGITNTGTPTTRSVAFGWRKLP